MNKQQGKRRTAAVRAVWLAASLIALGHGALAAVTDIASVPLSTATPSVVKPNLMFILDDSGSMDRDHMPDDADDFDNSEYGRKAVQCNGLAYNPGATYTLPVDSTGADYAAGTYTFPSPTDLNNIRTIVTPPIIVAGSVTVVLTSGSSGSYSNGDVVTLFSNSTPSQTMVGTVTAWNSTTKILIVNVTATSGSGSMADPRVGDGDNRAHYYTYSGSQPKRGFTYDSNSAVITSTDFYKECNSDEGSSPGNGVFTKVNVVASSAEAQKYRNWYAYYRTRILLMRTATSLAFKSIGDKYRVGFTTISSTGVSGNNFLDVADFDATHKASFYSKLFAAAPGSYTPLRGALSKVGKYYAKKAASQTYDPVQYSCQKNFTILTTDGYWNTDTESGSYGPFKLDGTNVGQQDGVGTPRPQKDDATPGEQARTSTLQQRSITAQWQTGTSTLQQRSITAQWQTATTRLQSRSGTLQTRTSTNGGGSWSSWSNTASCTWDTSGSSRRECRYNWGGWSNAATCSRSFSSGTSGTWNGNGIDCQYTAPPVNTITASCTPVAQSPGPIYTVATATQCSAQPPLYGAWSNAATCTASATTGCQYTTPVNTTTASCTPVAQSPGPIYTVATARTCSALPPVYGAWSNAATCAASATTGCQYTAWTSWSNVVSCAAVPQSAGPSYSVGTATECQSVVNGGTSDSLADVAQYYYLTDLRHPSLGNCNGGLPSGSDVCANDVSPKGDDLAQHQHMTTYTLGLGVNGFLKYDKDYLTQASGDYFDIKQGTKNWSAAGPSRKAENIDDLWHAAVNGRGQYFSAGEPASLAQSLTGALQSIEVQTGSASAAAASTLQPIQGDNSIFLALYTTVRWDGDLLAKTIDPETGAVSSTFAWSAQQKLDARVALGTPRDIRYFNKNVSGNGGALRAFTYANVAADGLSTNFDNACSKVPALTQCASLNAADLAAANSGSNLVSYLGGQTNTVYRTREHLLGDIIGGAPVYLKKPPFKYTENDYAGFVSSKSSRAGVVYVAANDGMLHAIDAVTGEEKWAYMPSEVLPKLYKLADKDYANRHEFFVNGAPVIGDIFVPGSPGQWKSILVGGLGAGGRSYYALDITDPNNPQALWEFKQDDLGLSFGNAVITKRANGNWVVAFSSGYNNVSPGDGNGHLFVVDANTGAQILKVGTFTSGSTPAGTATTPSGLGKINAWVDSELDNTALRFYGGDLLGNLWRFDLDNLVAPNQAALRLAQMQVGGVPQPITTKPSLAEVKYQGSPHPVVYVSTGKYLGVSDLSSTQQQTVYALKDPLTATGLGDVRTSTAIVAQTMTETTQNGATVRMVSNNAVDWNTKSGWRVDLLSSGERVNVDTQVVFNTLIVASNIPKDTVCGSAAGGGGSSYLYQFNIGTGSSSAGASGVAGKALGNTLVVGLTTVQLQKAGSAAAGSNQAGTGDVKIIVGDSIGGLNTQDGPPPPPAGGAVRRSSWRELVN